jgi:hypothetical protein
VPIVGFDLFHYVRPIFRPSTQRDASSRSEIHVGSERAGPRVAAILSVIETCRRYQISILQYLSSVLPGLAEFPANRVSELTPGSWAQS